MDAKHIMKINLNTALSGVLLMIASTTVAYGNDSDLEVAEKFAECSGFSKWAAIYLEEHKPEYAASLVDYSKILKQAASNLIDNDYASRASDIYAELTRMRLEQHGMRDDTAGKAEYVQLRLQHCQEYVERHDKALDAALSKVEEVPPVVIIQQNELSNEEWCQKHSLQISTVASFLEKGMSVNMIKNHILSLTLPAEDQDHYLNAIPVVIGSYAHVGTPATRVYAQEYAACIKENT
jgi:hypothetical protein